MHEITPEGTHISRTARITAGVIVALDFLAMAILFAQTVPRGLFTVIVVLLLGLSAGGAALIAAGRPFGRALLLPVSIFLALGSALFLLFVIPLVLFMVFTNVNQSLTWGAATIAILLVTCAAHVTGFFLCLSLQGP